MPKEFNSSIEDDSDTADDRSLFVQQTLFAESFHEEGLPRHIQNIHGQRLARVS